MILFQILISFEYKYFDVTFKENSFRVMFTVQTDSNSYYFLSFLLIVLLIQFSPQVGTLEFSFERYRGRDTDANWKWNVTGYLYWFKIFQHSSCVIFSQPMKGKDVGIFHFIKQHAVFAVLETVSSSKF